MNSFEVFNCFCTADSGKVNDALNQNGFFIITLNGVSIINKETFFRQAEKDIPQPEGLVAKNSWSALNDNLWSSVYGGKNKKVALVWTDAEQLLSTDVQSFLKAIDLFTLFAREVHSLKKEAKMESFILVLLGASSNFCNIDAQLTESHPGL